MMSAVVDDIRILDARAQQELFERYRDMMHKVVDSFVDSLAGAEATMSEYDRRTGVKHSGFAA